MKSSFLCFVIIVNLSCCFGVKNDKLLVYSICGLLNEHFSKRRFARHVDVILTGNENSFTVDKILRIKNDSTNVRVNKGVPDFLVTSTILFFDSMESFLTNIKQINFNFQQFTRYDHLIYISNANIEELESLNDDVVNFNVAYLLNHTENSIDLATSFLFTKENCRKNRLVFINRFEKSTMRWKNSNFYPEKFQNLNNCTLNVGTWDSMRSEYNVFQSFRKSFNFHMNLTRYKDPQEMFSDSSVDLFMQINSFADEYFLGYAYIYEMGVFFIPPGDPYTPLEKMFLPFDTKTWIAIIVTLSIGVVVIQIVNRCPVEIQHFIFGRDIQTPMVNFVSTILIGSQFKTPGRNFARFILMMFIIWCLIIRTAYQSVMFTNLQQDLRKPGIKSVRELFDRNFTLFWSKANHNYMKNLIKQEGYKE